MCPPTDLYSTKRIWRDIGMTEEYYTDYPTEPIGGRNPYYRCSYCKISVPQINGQIKNHAEWCEYRINKMKND